MPPLLTRSAERLERAAPGRGTGHARAAVGSAESGAARRAEGPVRVHVERLREPLDAARTLTAEAVARRHEAHLHPEPLPGQVLRRDPARTRHAIRSGERG